PPGAFQPQDRAQGRVDAQAQVRGCAIAVATPRRMLATLRNGLAKVRKVLPALRSKLATLRSLLPPVGSLLPSMLRFYGADAHSRWQWPLML
ncbi:hypothetical protein, partial [Nevskia sp.]|uniref:hypothetical protein n=1 Tax=Nevskia sp. TaxID=1929292 RepID=UPI003F7182F2